MQKNIFLSFFLFMCFFSQAQTNLINRQAVLDSLYSVWQNQNYNDSTRAVAYKEYIWKGFLYSQPDTAFKMAEELLVYGTDKNCLTALALGYLTQGVTWHIGGNYAKALKYYIKSLKIQEQIGNQKGVASCLNNIGLIYVIQGNYVKALDCYKKGLEIERQIGNQKGVAVTLNNIGIIFNDQGNYPKAVDYYTRSLKIERQIGDQKGMAICLNNIGIIYQNQGDYAKALDYHTQSLKIKEQIGDQLGIAPSLHNIGEAFKGQSDYSKALDYFTRSLRIKEHFGDQKGISISVNSIGEVYLLQGNYSTALGYYMRSLKINEEISDKRATAITLNNIGKISNKQGDHMQAINWCKIGLETSREINTLEEQKSACECLYDSYKALGNGTKALEYHEEIMLLDDSLQAKETTKKLQQMEFAKQVSADSLAREQEKLNIQMAHEAKVRRKTRTRNIYIVIGIFLFVFAIGFYRRMIYIKKTKRAVESEKERSDKLLLNILPSEIADELKEKGRAEAQSFERVSVLFSNFKGFSQISEKLSAAELVDEINVCFKAFDGICEKYGIEKIKTIGDTYMAAGGLPAPSDDSIKSTVMAGIEMMEFMQDNKKEKESEGKIYFEMRLGVHTGPVVAGIVGVAKFQYDIWGDAVNTASRMENAGEVGKVNVSIATFELMKEDPIFNFHSRGKVKVKGKGEIEMWFVEKI